MFDKLLGDIAAAGTWTHTVVARSTPAGAIYNGGGVYGTCSFAVCTPKRSG